MKECWNNFPLFHHSSTPILHYSSCDLPAIPSSVAGYCGGRARAAQARPPAKQARRTGEAGGAERTDSF
jgi:hypothetical protein